MSFTRRPFFISKLLFIAPLFLFSISEITAQTPPALTLKQIYSEGAFRAKGFGPARFLEDGKGYTTLEKSATTAGRDIVKYDSETGAREVLISAQRLIPRNQKEPLEIRDYNWSNDGRKLLIFTNTRRVWRRHTRGDYWVLNLKTWLLQKVGVNIEPTTMMFAKFSPDADKVAFVSKQNIYVEDLMTEETRQLTHDGGGHIINGTFDWVYEEELSCRDGFRWSPDGKHIAYWQLDTEGIGTFYMINNIDSIYASLIPLPYPKVGTTNPAAKIGTIPVSGGPTKWLPIPGDPRNNYLARMEFAANSNELIIQQLNRAQNKNKVMLANIHSGALRTVLIEQDETWVEIHNDFKWLNNGSHFTWTSERDGWNHLYVISRDGSEVRPVTKGDFDVIRVLMIDEKQGYAYYIASPENPTQRYLYRSRLDGVGNAERVTPGGQAGQHAYQISPDTRWAIHRWQNASTPVTIDFVDLLAHKQMRVLENNDALRKKVADLRLPKKEFHRIQIEEGLELHAWMIKPDNFDASKKYPLIFYVYGEPAGSTVQDNFGGNDWYHHFLAQQGYIIMSIDNRGTKMPRGRAWRKSIYKQIGILASLDQKAATDEILRRFSFIDPERIGIWGWSGGGSMTLNMMFRYPETYKTGVAIAFISDQKIYDTIYQERYMGLPSENEFGYREGSPITHARNLEGNLLLVHGSGDDNCHYQSCEMLINELVKRDKMFDMIEYPMRSHGIFERENTSLHLRKTMTRHFLRNLPPGPRPE